MYDYLAIFDGENQYYPLVGKFCGSRKPLTLISSFNMMYLLFRSDATNEKRGFNATHSTGKFNCAQISVNMSLYYMLINFIILMNFTVCSGVRLQAHLNHTDYIYSHTKFDGNTTYKSYEDCTWLIESNDNQRVRIEFTFFALELDGQCSYDKTIVYDGPDEQSPQLAHLCGSNVSSKG